MWIIGVAALIEALLIAGTEPSLECPAISVAEMAPVAFAVFRVLFETTAGAGAAPAAITPFSVALVECVTLDMRAVVAAAYGDSCSAPGVAICAPVVSASGSSDRRELSSDGL